MGVLFVIVCGLCILLFGGCVCYCVGVVSDNVWGFYLVLNGGCVSYCVGVVFVVVIFFWLLKFNNVVWDDFGVV